MLGATVINFCICFRLLRFQTAKSIPPSKRMRTTSGARSRRGPAGEAIYVLPGLAPHASPVPSFSLRGGRPRVSSLPQPPRAARTAILPRRRSPGVPASALPPDGPWAAPALGGDAAVASPRSSGVPGTGRPGRRWSAGMHTSHNHNIRFTAMAAATLPKPTRRRRSFHRPRNSALLRRRWERHPDHPVHRRYRFPRRPRSRNALEHSVTTRCLALY